MNEPKIKFFEGEYKHKPEQSLGGCNKLTPREELIRRAALERQQRQDLRNKTVAAIKIQSNYRKYITRKKLDSNLRVQFNVLLAKCGKRIESTEELSSLIKWLIIFYSVEIDSERLIQLGQLILKQKDDMIHQLKVDANIWMYRTQRFLELNVTQISAVESNHNQLIAIPLRLIEVFTSSSSYLKEFDDHDSRRLVSNIWTHLIRKDYFKKLRCVIDTRVPEPFEEATKSPTQLASSLLELVSQPLNQEYASHDGTCYVILRFFEQLLCGPFSPQIKYLVIPITVSKKLLLLKPEHILNGLLDVPKTGVENSLSSTLKLPSNLWLMFTVVKICSPQILTSSTRDRLVYVHLLKLLSQYLPEEGRKEEVVHDDVDDDSREVPMDESDVQMYRDHSVILNEILECINQPNHVQSIVTLLDDESPSEAIISLSCLCYAMLSCDVLAVHKYRLLYSLAFKSRFLRKLWQFIRDVSTPSVFGSPTSLLQVLSRGLPLAAVEWDHILPQLTLFCSLLAYLLPTVDDVEFYESTSEQKKQKVSSMPFTLVELQSMTLILRDVCLGLIELAYHDTKITIKSEEYKRAVDSVRDEQKDVSQETSVKVWLRLFKTSVHLLRQLHMRDSRRAFCPPGHWISRQISIPVEKPTNFRVANRQRERYQEFVGLRRLTRSELEDGGPPLSTTEVRNITILQEIPFVVPFTDRVKILQLLMIKDKKEVRGMGHNFLVSGSTIDIMIRRNYIYEDAFEKLSPENEPELKKPFRVQLVNAVGLDEAGIDGGGIFREFMNELLKACFDPNRGFFSTSHDRLLFPNPSSRIINGDFQKHYYFIGRMLGKALYENMLVELPFATFFLAKLLARTSTSDVDIHHLATLDPTMYKNLVYLKNYDGDVSELGLDFTIVNSDLGENEEVELKPGGKNTIVTAQNRIEYIHLMADYRLNKQIRAHCSAFKNGLSDVIDLDWIRMFSPKELQVLISGAPTPIDLEDLKINTKYSGGYEESHPVIKCFWRVVNEFNETQRRQLLKFVTSCSRPPLLGFKDLQPPFCIQFAGREERLPTSSTCMNLLKLPEYLEKEALKSKLLYAIESGVGFELS